MKTGFEPILKVDDRIVSRLRRALFQQLPNSGSITPVRLWVAVDKVNGRRHQDVPDPLTNFVSVNGEIERVVLLLETGCHRQEILDNTQLRLSLGFALLPLLLTRF